MLISDLFPGLLLVGVVRFFVTVSNCLMVSDPTLRVS
jgi:hypothetical protein